MLERAKRDADRKAELIASRKRAVELAHESSKQILTLASAIIVLAAGALFTGKLLINSYISGLVVAVFAFLVSVVFGILSLYALSGLLEEGLYLFVERPLLTDHYRNFGVLQFIFFTLGTVLLVVSMIVYSVSAP